MTDRRTRQIRKTINYRNFESTLATCGQRAMRHGIDGKSGVQSNVESATCGACTLLKSTDPHLGHQQTKGLNNRVPQNPPVSPKPSSFPYCPKYLIPREIDIENYATRKGTVETRAMNDLDLGRPTGPRPDQNDQANKISLIRFELLVQIEGLQNLYSPVRLRSAPPTNKTQRSNRSYAINGAALAPKAKIT